MTEQAENNHIKNFAEALNSLYEEDYLPTAVHRSLEKVADTKLFPVIAFLVMEPSESLPSVASFILDQSGEFQVLNEAEVSAMITTFLTPSHSQDQQIKTYAIKDRTGRSVALLVLQQDVFDQTASSSEALLLQCFIKSFKKSVKESYERFEQQKRTDYLEKILNSIPSDLVAFDKEHRYQFINPVAIKNKEVREWLIGKDDYDYVEYRDKSRDLAHNRRAIFNEVLSTKKPYSFEEKNINQNGESEWKLRMLYPVNSEGGEEIQMVLGYGLDITEIKQKNDEVISTNTRLKTLISSLNSGILLEDQHRRILVTNQVFCTMFGIPAEPDQLIGMDCSNSAEQSKHLIEDEEEFVQNIEALLKARKPKVNELIRFKDGRIFERDFIPIFNNSFYLGHLWEYRDVTLKKKTEQEMIRALEAERSFNELNKNFVSMVSHEFRTPLTSIYSTAELLLDFGDRFNGEELKKRVQRIYQSSIKMEQLIEDVLTIGKLDSNNTNLQVREVDVEESIQDILHVLKGSVLKDHTITIDSAMNHKMLKTDSNLFELIIRNILENAGKYSPEDSDLELAIKLDEYQFTFVCKDFGIGIPSQELDVVFETFKRGSNTSNIPGTGLGLPIVKKSIERLNGSLKIESAVQQGTRVEVVIPQP